MIIDSTSPTSRIETTISVLALSRFILVLVSIYSIVNPSKVTRTARSLRRRRLISTAPSRRRRSQTLSDKVPLKVRNHNP